jgi:hypothetical protein
LDGYLSMIFEEEDEGCHRRYMGMAQLVFRRTIGNELTLWSQGSCAAPCHVRPVGGVSLKGIS